MSSDNGADFRLDLADWSAPVIADRIGEHYARWLGDASDQARDRVVRVARCHCRMWRCLLQAQDREARVCRRALLQLGSENGLSVEQIDSIDKAVIAELMNIIISRFSRSRGEVHAYGMTLVSAATCLTEVRLTASSRLVA
jgi:hypothetical protein